MKQQLGDHEITIRFFDGVEQLLKELKRFPRSNLQLLKEQVNRTLLELIQKEGEPCFLLPAVLDYIKKVEEAKILTPYQFSHFELWLNQYSNLSFEENYGIRAKIAGKKVERGDYQPLFPVGMGKVYEGTHFVTAHKSPDLDTTIASFWGWLDAFAARIGDGLHIWNLPDGPPPSQIEIEWIFRDLFGEGIFTHLPKTRTVLHVTATDLMTQRGLQRKGIEESMSAMTHDAQSNAILVVDEEGYFLGDWRASDVEGVQQVIVSVSSCLRWFENNLHLQLISSFAKEKLHLDDIETVLKKLLATRLKECEPSREFSIKQKGQMDAFLRNVLGIKKGLETDFEEFALVLSRLGQLPFGGVSGLLEKMKKGKLFDTKGYLVDERPRIFRFLEEAIQSLHQAILLIRSRMEKLDIALQTKERVFGALPHTISMRSDVEEIKTKIGAYSYLTVVDPDHERLYPVGIVQAADLKRGALGTVSLRDFCNREEMGIPPYLEVISIIDHHKSALNTLTPAMAILSDAQSSNTLVAQKAFEINDANRKKPSFIDPGREYIEYLHFLYGIIDDTDLLSKVSPLDVQCVASLLNRLKTLATGKKTKIIQIEDLPRDRHFAKKAAERILQNEDMYSLYRKVYQYREKEVEKNLSLCAKGESSNLFADTKEQNGCCRVGQTKLFAANIPHFEKHAHKIRQVWLHQSMKTQKEKKEIDLHMHMISTIVNAEEVYKGKAGTYSHLDELWIWIPNQEMGIEHLKQFLSGFQSSPGLKDRLKGKEVEVEFLGTNGAELSQIFKESFADVPHRMVDQELPIAVLKYKAGTLNSRKAMVSPYLPRRDHP